MSFPEYIFKHKSLTTIELDTLIKIKNSLYKNNNAPSTLETVTADEFPKNANKRISKRNDHFEKNWICNNDSLNKPGTHWICVLTTQKPANDEDKIENCMCIHQNYYLIDSWGNTFSKKIYNNILNTLNKQIQHSDLVHKMARKKSFYISNCKCRFEIILPIIYRIQKFNYTNCGWYALFFTQFNENTLFDWIKNNVKEGVIKQLYIIMRNYFTNYFFKSCKSLNGIKDDMDKKSKNSNECKQCCVSPNDCKL